MKFESKPAANMLLYVVIIVVGFLLMYLARDFSHAGSNVLCGFLLGCMLSGLGVLGMAVGESRTVELDERRKWIVLDVRRRVGGGGRLLSRSVISRGSGSGCRGKQAPDRAIMMWWSG
jgi:hypothetical protein